MLLCSPVQRKGRGQQPFEGQIDRLRALDNGGLDPGRETGQRDDARDIAFRISDVRNESLQRCPGPEGGGPAMGVADVP